MNVKNVNTNGREKMKNKNLKHVQDVKDMIGKMKVKRNDKQSRKKNNKRQLYEKQKGVCNLCKNNLELEIPVLDHIVPLGMNGKDELNNMQLLCFNCHWEKTNIDMKEIWLFKKNELEFYDICFDCGEKIIETHPSKVEEQMIIHKRSKHLEIK